MAGCNEPTLPRPKAGMLTQMFSYVPGAMVYVSCQMPTSPFVPMALLNARHAGRCAACRSFAQAMSRSTVRQYWTMIVVRPNHISPPSTPVCGFAANAWSMRGMARSTGHHLRSFHTLLIRMPMRKTTKAPSRFAVRRS